MKMPTFTETAEGAMKRLSRPVRLAFLAALGTGLVVYLFALTNRIFCTGDALNNVLFDGNLSWMGRWSCQLLSSLGTDLSIPPVNGMLMITAMAVMAAVTVSLLEIRSDVLAVLAAGVIMCHPSAGATLKYLHNADGYMIAALLAVIGDEQAAGSRVVRGTASVDVHTGAHLFAADDRGLHAYVIKERPDSFYADAINARVL